MITEVTLPPVEATDCPKCHSVLELDQVNEVSPDADGNPREMIYTDLFCTNPACHHSRHAID